MSPRPPPVSTTQGENPQDSVHSPTHGYELLQQKDTKLNQQREKAHGVKSDGNQAQASKAPFPSAITENTLNSPATSCDNTCENAVCKGNLLETQYPEFFFGAGHISTLCLACAKIPDSKKENRYSA